MARNAASYGGLRCQAPILFPQLFLAFPVLGVFGYALDRADFHALRRVEMPHALGAQ
ncbi:hypothetical protein D3C83_162960 [compost metagenome]